MAPRIYPNDHFISSSHNPIASSIRKRSTRQGMGHTFLTPSLRSCFALLALGLVAGGCATIDPKELTSCISYAWEGFRPIATDRTARFLGKVEEDTARCRGGNDAVEKRRLPWMDWQNYWPRGFRLKGDGRRCDFRQVWRGRTGHSRSLLDLEYQRMEMIKFNLFDNSGTYERYVRGRKVTDSEALRKTSGRRCRAMAR
jgi:hypothetical protein